MFNMDTASKANGNDGIKTVGCSNELQVISKMEDGINKFKALRDFNHKMYMETERV